MKKGLAKKILIADDAIPIRIMLEEVLSEAGYDVITASDGEEALNIINSRFNELDLMVLDLLMPKMSGFEVLSRLKGKFPQRKFPILVTSGVFKSEKEIKKLKELGANGYLNKTSIVDEILYRVNAFFYPNIEGERKFPRVLCSIPVDYQFNGIKNSSHTTTLSIGGCFIRTLKPGEKDTPVNLWFTISDRRCNELILVQGRIAWSNCYVSGYKPNSPPGMGIEFKNIQKEYLNCLKNLIEQKLKQEEIWKKP